MQRIVTTNTGNSPKPAYDEVDDFGFRVDWVGNRLVVLYVDLGSPANIKGVKRGDTIVMVNNISVPAEPTAQFKSSIYRELFWNDSVTLKIDGRADSVALTRDIYKERHIFFKDVITSSNNTKIGYLAFNSFAATGNTDDTNYDNDNSGLDTVFKGFAIANISELVLDLRYNGGGLVNVSSYLASLIAGQELKGKVYKNIYFNDRKFSTSNIDLRLSFLDYYYLNSKKLVVDYLPELGDKTYYFDSLPNSLNLKRVFIITGENTASASESLINGLRAHIDVKLIGTKSHGKPVGMINLRYKDIIFVPIMFRGENALGVGDFYNGIQPDKEVADDFSRDLGSPDEGCLKEALYYIANGNFSQAQ